MKDKHLFSIFAGILLIIIIFLMIMGDPLFILVGIILGIIFLLGIVAVILEEFFPNNKLSKKLDKAVGWITDSIHF